MGSKFNVTVAIMLVLLVIQYVAGMVTNLFVQIPSSVSSRYQSGGAFYHFWGDALRWIFAHGSGSIQLHATIGVILVILSILLVGMSISMRHRVWTVWSLFGCIFTIGAGVNGMFFVSFGQHDINSLVMSLAFMAAFVCYVAGTYAGRRTRSGHYIH